MIHAYLFMTHNNKDRNDHGPEFHKHMNRINQAAGTNITVILTALIYSLVAPLDMVLTLYAWFLFNGES